MRVRARERVDDGDVCGVERHVLAALDERQRTLADEIDLEAEQRIEPMGAVLNGGGRLVYLEQPDDEAADMGSHPHDEV
jgi:hypothetical protein